MQKLQVKLFDSPKDAPTYNAPEYKAVKLKAANLVGNGTESGNITVDLILEDEKGNKYIAMTTLTLVGGLFASGMGLKERLDDV